jgi:C-terminal processing protease CtpA/Prc
MLQKNYDVTHNGVDFQKLVDQSHEHDELFKPREAEVGDVMVLKLTRLLLTDSAIDGYIHKASKHSALVLDLRENVGGSEENLERVLGAILENDTKVGDRIERSGLKPLLIKSRGGHAYSGKLIVLINSKSESASEVIARVVQLEKRGTVVGDRSAGRVMRAKRFLLVPGANQGMRYGVLVSVADLKMSDGKSLEHQGVTPDEVVLPTAEELAAGADPQMSRALQLAGVPLSSAKAGLLFPKVWE